MLHDLLLAVTGHGGDVFVEKESRFEIANDLGFFHPSEIAIIHQLLNLGYHYKKVKIFCDTYDTVQIKKDADYRGGLYLSSLAVALRKTIQEYHSAVVELELKLMNDPQLPLSQLLLALQPLAPLVAAVSTLVTEIENKKVRGCMILEVLHKHTANSVAYIKEVLMRVEQAVHSVLYDQLTHWLLYGQLLDPHNELFIHTSKALCSDKADQTPDVEGLSLEESEDVIQKTECKLRLEMLPNHIPLLVAEKILFIGESILIFEREGKNGSVDASSVSSLCGLVLKSREEEFLQLIQSLANTPTFSIIQFSQVIETIRHCVSQQLWTLVLEAGLVAELADLKAVFLLGRGELYQTLIPAITPFFHNTSVATNVDGLFQLAGQQVLLEEGMLEKFTLSLKPQSPKSAPASIQQGERSWKILRLDYNAKWPLHKLFTPAVQDKYNAIFTFLLDVRRAQYRLQQLWIMQMRAKNNEDAATSVLQWALRHHMNLLIDNIQYYLQVDVLESQYWQLIEEIGKTRDYQHLASTHHNFLVSITAQCFLNNQMVSNALQRLLKLIHNFCTIMETTWSSDNKRVPRFDSTSSSEQSSITDRAKQIREFSEAFERAAAQLFLILSNLKLHQGSQYTSQLIMRIDYNKFCSKSATVRRFTSPLEVE